jgi:hypothetical protein
MKKGLAVLGLVAALALMRPAPAHASFSLGIAVPGFGLSVNGPYPPPVAYAPPVYYGPPVAYYPPPPVVYPYFYAGYGHAHGWHRGWYGHGHWH